MAQAVINLLPPAKPAVDRSCLACEKIKVGHTRPLRNILAQDANSDFTSLLGLPENLSENQIRDIYFCDACVIRVQKYKELKDKCKNYKPIPEDSKRNAYYPPLKKICFREEKSTKTQSTETETEQSATVQQNLRSHDRSVESDRNTLGNNKPIQSDHNIQSNKNTPGNKQPKVLKCIVYPNPLYQCKTDHPYPLPFVIETPDDYDSSSMYPLETSTLSNDTGLENKFSSGASTKDTSKQCPSSSNKLDVLKKVTNANDENPSKPTKNTSVLQTAGDVDNKCSSRTSQELKNMPNRSRTGVNNKTSSEPHKETSTLSNLSKGTQCTNENTAGHPLETTSVLQSSKDHDHKYSCRPQTDKSSITNDSSGLMSISDIYRRHHPIGRTNYCDSETMATSEFQTLRIAINRIDPSMQSSVTELASKIINVTPLYEKLWQSLVINCNGEMDQACGTHTKSVLRGTFEGASTNTFLESVLREMHSRCPKVLDILVAMCRPLHKMMESDCFTPAVIYSIAMHSRNPQMVAFQKMIGLECKRYKAENQVNNKHSGNKSLSSNGSMATVATSSQKNTSSQKVASKPQEPAKPIDRSTAVKLIANLVNRLRKDGYEILVLAGHVADKSFIQQGTKLGLAFLEENTVPYLPTFTQYCRQNVEASQAEVVIASAEPSSTSTMKRVKTTFTCEVCEKSYAMKKSLRNHILSTGHTTLNQKISTKFTKKCPQCDKVFGGKAKLRRHMVQVHIRGKRHTCEVCGKGYVYQSNLRQHRQTHTGGGPTCDICSQVFRSDQNLSEHMKHSHDIDIELSKYDPIKARQNIATDVHDNPSTRSTPIVSLTKCDRNETGPNTSHGIKVLPIYDNKVSTKTQNQTNSQSNKTKSQQGNMPSNDTEVDTVCIDSSENEDMDIDEFGDVIDDDMDANTGKQTTKAGSNREVTKSFIDTDDTLIAEMVMVEIDLMKHGNLTYTIDQRDVKLWQSCAQKETKRLIDFLKLDINKKDDEFPSYSVSDQFVSDTEGITGRAMKVVELYQKMENNSYGSIVQDNDNVCPFCDLSIEGNSAVKKHLENHKLLLEQFIESCSFCGVNLPAGYMVYHPCAKMERGFSHKIEVWFSDVRDFVAHVETKLQFQNVEEPVMCNVCNNEQPNSSEYWRHFLESHIQTFTCNCGEIFFTKDEVIRHEKPVYCRDSILVKSCKTCKVKFTDRDLLLAHLQECHQRSAFFMCETCDICCSCEYLLSDHKCDKFLCNICGQKFLKNGALKHHQEWVHGMGEPKECMVCHKIYKGPNSLRNHMIVHSTEKYICEVCGMLYKRRSGLKSHMDRNHPKEKKRKLFTCEVCEKSYAMKKSLNNHILLTGHTTLNQKSQPN